METLEASDSFRIIATMPKRSREFISAASPASRSRVQRHVRLPLNLECEVVSAMGEVDLPKLRAVADVFSWRSVVVASVGQACAAMCRDPALIGPIMAELRWVQGSRFARRVEMDADAVWNVCETGRLDLVRDTVPLWKRGCDMSDSLEEAARGGDLELLRLIMHGSPTTRALRSPSVFLAAVEGGNLDVVSELEPHACSTSVITEALSEAAIRGFTAIAQKLLPHSDADAKCDALMLAAGLGHTQVVKFMLPHAPSAATDALRLAANNGRLDIVRSIIDDVEVGTDAFAESLCAAVRGNHVDVARVLVEFSNVDAIEKALRSTASADMTRLLLGRGARSREKERALKVAAARGHTDVVKELLKFGVDATPRVLLGASEGNHVSVLRVLLPSATPEAAVAALCGAVRCGHVESASLLTTFCDVNQLDAETQVHLVERGSTDMINMLSSRGLSWKAMWDSQFDHLVEAAGRISAIVNAPGSDAEAAIRARQRQLRR